MPIYEYRCGQCGETIDVLQKMNEPAPASCAHCGAENSLVRKVSRTSFVLKGGGWYADLYSSPKKDSKPSGDSATSAPAAPSSAEGSSGGGSSSTTAPAASAAAPTK
jgi:putative FmdB family regulatory protein